MWKDLSNSELRLAIMKIVNSSRDKDEVNSRAKAELGYPYRIAVAYSEPNAAGGRMSMFMAHGHNGKTLA